MKIIVKVENENMSKKPRDKEFDVPEEECHIFVERDLELRRAAADDPETVQPRTAQEIMDEFNRGLENAHRRTVRHYGELKTPYHKDDEEAPDPWDNIPDYSDEIRCRNNEDYEEMCQKLHVLLKAEHAEVIIAVVLNDVTIADFADLHGLSYEAAAKRLQRAKKKLLEKLS